MLSDDAAMSGRRAPIWRDIILVSAMYLVAAGPVAGSVDPREIDALLSLPFGAALAALSTTALRGLRLPDQLTLSLILAGLGASLLFGWDKVAVRAIAAATGFAILFGAFSAYRYLRAQEDFDSGEAKLFAASGAWLGPAALPQVLLAACLMALIAVAAQRLSRHRRVWARALPFGPFLAFATWLIWLYGPI